MSRYIREPELSCPKLDDAISAIEEARKIHEKLREWGQAGWDKAAELEEEVTRLEKELEGRDA
jgi:hypothetical protein